ncbi:hypothetical protein D3C72_1619040 [compost metagenome]
MALQIVDNLSGHSQRIGQFLNRAAVEVDQLMAGTGLPFGLISGLGRLLSVACDLSDAGGHLVDGRCDLVGFTLLLQAIAMAALQRLRQRTAVPGQASRSVANASDHCAELALEHTQGKINLTDAITPAGVQLLAQRIISDRQRLGTQTLERFERRENHQRAQTTGEQHLQQALPGQHR